MPAKIRFYLVCSRKGRAKKGEFFSKMRWVKQKISIFAGLKSMPDRLKAGLQVLVLTMLVRIQLGQREKD